jgi:hypothetical protein
VAPGEWFVSTVKEFVGSWIWPRVRVTPGESRAAANPVREATSDAGEYELLSKYLRDRYADRIVLTFSEIEDLLGFSLPVAARLHREWWDEPNSTTDRSAQADAWKLASRTASVNMLAQIVLFERWSPLDASRGK